MEIKAYYHRLVSTFLFLSILSLYSCGLFGPDPKMGCTTCIAENYDPEAELDDGSCVLPHKELIGTYRVQDSIVGPFQDVYYSEPYEIEVIYEACNDDELLIVNYAQLKNAATDEPLEIQIRIEPDSIDIIRQGILKLNDGLETNYDIFRTKGYIKGDKIWFPISYSTPLDPYYGHCWGEKVRSPF